MISVSYGQIEGALPRFYQERQCREWMKLALQGVSVIFASGDSGVANRYNSGYNNSCLNDEFGYVDENGTRFSPSFPANCPYVSTNKSRSTLNFRILTLKDHLCRCYNTSELLHLRWREGCCFSKWTSLLLLRRWFLQHLPTSFLAVEGGRSVSQKVLAKAVHREDIQLFRSSLPRCLRPRSQARDCMARQNLRYWWHFGICPDLCQYHQLVERGEAGEGQGTDRIPEPHYLQAS